MSKCKFKVGDVLEVVNADGWGQWTNGDKLVIKSFLGNGDGFYTECGNTVASMFCRDFKLASQQYKLEHFEKDIRTFNERCGNKVATKEMSLAEAIQVILPQAKVIREEANELLHACETANEQEILDGAVDTLVTSLRLISLLKERYDILGACKDVMENNHLKYTTSVEEAQKWFYDSVNKGINQSELTKIDGQAYYCNKNQNGKIMKWDGFPKVDLSKYIENVQSSKTDGESK